MTKETLTNDDIMSKRYRAAQIGSAQEIQSGKWEWGVKDGDKVVLVVNHLNPFRGNLEPQAVADIAARALNEHVTAKLG